MKRSFSLIETLFSIILLSIIISGFLNLSFEGVGFKNHMDLQTLKNKIASEEFSLFSKDKVDLDFTIEENSTLTYTSGDTYTKYSYLDQFNLTIYDIPAKEVSLKSRVFE